MSRSSARPPAPRHAAAALVLLLASFPGSVTAQRADTASDWLEVHVVDVGQGDGIWIHTCDDGIPGNGVCEGKNIVIDGGPTAADAKNPFLAYLRRLPHPPARIDALILTHPHDDHYPGAEGVLRHFEVCDYYDPGYPDRSALYQHFLALVRQGRCNGAPTRLHIGRATFGTPDWGSELTVDFLYAWPGSPDGLGHGNTLVNNASIVLKLTYGTQSILLMGDAEGKDREGDAATPKYVEERLLAEVGAARLKATVLKVAHHGSETSSTLPFIRAVDPEIVVISSGRKSFAGTFLPDMSTLRRYCAFNPAIRIYRTDQNDEAEGRTTKDDADGDDVVIRMGARRTEVDAYEGGRPFVPPACDRMP